jgi:hypothetical protein
MEEAFFIAVKLVTLVLKEFVVQGNFSIGIKYKLRAPALIKE